MTRNVMAAKVKVVTDGLPPATINQLFVEHAPSVEEAVEGAIRERGPQATIARQFRRVYDPGRSVVADRFQIDEPGIRRVPHEVTATHQDADLTHVLEVRKITFVKAAIGDVQGHNVNAAALMGQVRTAVHATAGAAPMSRRSMPRAATGRSIHGLIASQMKWRKPSAYCSRSGSCACTTIGVTVPTRAVGSRASRSRTGQSGRTKASASSSST